MVQDIRGTTTCKECSHLGVSHVAGFFCIAKDCQCGHEKNSERHQKACASCLPRSMIVAAAESDVAIKTYIDNLEEKDLP